MFNVDVWRMRGLNTQGAAIIPRIQALFGPLATNTQNESIKNLRTAIHMQNTRVFPKMINTNVVPEVRYAIGFKGQKGALKNA